MFPELVVFKTSNFTISQDCEIPIPGFFILFPNRKIDSVAEFNYEEEKEFISLLKKIRIGMKQVLNIDKVYLYQNENSEHGFHFWILPRHIWMEKFGTKLDSVRPIMNYARENMKTDEIIEEVYNFANRMKNYMGLISF